MNQLRVAKLLLDYFDELGVVAVLGGSMASSLIGEPRATNDVDLAAALSHDTAKRLIGKLGEAFYADLSAIEEAVTHRSSFNVIHLATATKVDVFVLGDGLLDRRQAGRRVQIELADEDKTLLWVSSPEDQALRNFLGTAWDGQCRTGNGATSGRCSKCRQAPLIVPILRKRPGSLGCSTCCIEQFEKLGLPSQASPDFEPAFA